MSIIPTSRGNPQASDTAVEALLPMTGNSAREDLQSTLALNDAQVSKLYEDRNLELSQGGLISFSGGSLTFSEVLTLEVNSRVAGGTPVVIPLGVTSPNAFSGPFSLPTSGTMVYAVIDRIAGTAVVTDAATTLPAVNSANQEVFLIGKRNDAADGTKRFYFRDGTGISSGQTIRLGAGTGTTVPAGFIQMTGSVAAAAGYLLCDGSPYNITDFPDLAAALFDSSTGNYAYGAPGAGAASFTGTITGTATPVVLTAVTPGSAGNSIDLTFSSTNLAESLTNNDTDDLSTFQQWASQAFTAVANASITNATWKLSYVGGSAPTGTMQAQIYAISGGVPSGVALANSSTVNGSTITSTPTPIQFNFPTPLAVTSGTQYCLVLNISGIVFGIGGGIIVACDDTAPYSGGEYSTTSDAGTTWTLAPTISAYFSVDSGLPAINDEITAWNTANPSNQVTLTSGDGTQIPSSGANAQLAGGFDAGTKFNVPDLRGMFTRGIDSTGVNDPDFAARTATPGGNSGGNIGSVQVDGFMDHIHNVTPFTGNTGSNTGSPPKTYPSLQPIQAGGVNTGSASPLFGPGIPTDETRPKNVYVNYIIKF